jgi:hypothetical protein
MQSNVIVIPVILDGINDQGLSVGLFYFPNYAKYTDGRRRQGRDAHHRDGRHDANHRQRLDQLRRREVGINPIASGRATRWPIAYSEAYGQTIRQRPKKPRLQKHPG